MIHSEPNGPLNGPHGRQRWPDNIHQIPPSHLSPHSRPAAISATVEPAQFIDFELTSLPEISASKMLARLAAKRIQEIRHVFCQSPAQVRALLWLVSSPIGFACVLT